MNKFLFLTKDHQESQQNFLKKEKEIIGFYRDKDYKLNFSSDGHNSSIIFEGRRIGPIIKSEIQESVKVQINQIKADVGTRGSLLFVKMNSVTKNKLRTFLSYEVDHIPRNETNKQFCGNMMGIPIIVDESLVDFTVVTFIKKHFINKFKFIEGEDSNELQKINY